MATSRVRILLCLGLIVLAAAPAARAETAQAGAGEGQLKFVLILGRHGVRTPLDPYSGLAARAEQPWPDWGQPPGTLTPHGAQLMTLLGKYYRELYLREGLLTGDVRADASRVFLQSDNDERTIESVRHLAMGLLPGGHAAVFVPVPPGQTDPLYRPVTCHVGTPDVPLAIQALLGRIGHDPAALANAHRSQLELFQRVFFPDGVGPGKRSAAEATPGVGPDRQRRSDIIVSVDPFHACMSLTEDLMLEYEDGRPMSEVGWGRVNKATLTELMGLHSTYWDMVHRTLYVAQVEGSNIAAHVLATLDQAVSGRAQRGAFGTPDDRIVVIGGHDSNIVDVSGLLGVTWTMPDTQMIPTLPGCAMVFEVRERAGDPKPMITVRIISQTLDQLRNLEPLSLAHPPFSSPLFIPACSTAAPGDPAPYPKFKELMERVILPQFTRM